MMMLRRWFINGSYVSRRSITTAASLLISRWSRVDKSSMIPTSTDGWYAPADVLQYLHQKGSQVDSYDYVKLLQSCVKAKDLAVGKQVHEHILRFGMKPNVYIINTLLKLYVHCGSVNEARRLFDKFSNKSVVSWNVMISGYAHRGLGQEAFNLFTLMQQEGLEPDKFTFVSILSACSSPAALNWGREVHVRVMEAGLANNTTVGNALISMYAKCGSVRDARRVFDAMASRDEVSWTTLTGAYAESGYAQESLKTYHAMLQEGVRPSRITYMNVLSACGSLAALEKGKQIHAHIVESEHHSDVRVSTALTKMYIKCGAVKDAREVFECLPNRDVIAWNTMIGGLVDSGQLEEAHGMFHRMLKECVAPDRVTYLAILSACARPGGLACGKEIHARAVKDGLVSDVRFGNALINMYSKAGSMKDARQVFDRMPKRDVVSWTALVGGYAECGQVVESFSTFKKMLQQGVEANKITYMCVLKACSNPVALKWGKEIHAEVVKAGIFADLAVANALMSMYFKCGSVEDAIRVSEGMSTRDVVTWNTLIGGLAQNGRGLEALQKFEVMKSEEMRPNATTFVNVMSACRVRNLVEEGRRQFASMRKDYGIVPTEKHYACMVDILARAGHLGEAEDVILTMPFKPSAAMWGALLAACRAHGNVEIGEQAAEQCLKLEPQNAGTYVSLSSIYAAAGMWRDVAKLRKLMKERGVKKEPGRSWIEVAGEVHSFVAGDQSHPRTEEIYSELEALTKQIKSLGYVPDTRFVMHDLDQEGKERAVCHHSEKLAIAYGLISTPPETPIRVSKNLRVCTDCHTATKLISKITGREIIARDAHRFHHFKNDQLTCVTFIPGNWTKYVAKNAS